MHICAHICTHWKHHHINLQMTAIKNPAASVGADDADV